MCPCYSTFTNVFIFIFVTFLRFLTFFIFFSGTFLHLCSMLTGQHSPRRGRGVCCTSAVDGRARHDRHMLHLQSQQLRLRASRPCKTCRLSYFWCIRKSVTHVTEIGADFDPWLPSVRFTRTHSLDVWADFGYFFQQLVFLRRSWRS